jgi:hypothetical protein
MTPQCILPESLATRNSERTNMKMKWAVDARAARPIDSQLLARAVLPACVDNTHKHSCTALRHGTRHKDALVPYLGNMQQALLQRGRKEGCSDPHTRKCH